MRKFIPIMLLLLMASCTTKSRQLTIDAVTVWSDAQMLASAYKGTIPAVEENKDKFTDAEMKALLDFKFIADYLVYEFQTMGLNETTLIAVDEIEMLWREAQAAFAVVRPVILAHRTEFSISYWVALRRFDDRARTIDKEMEELIAGKDQDATRIMSEIATVLGLTLKIVAVAATL